MLVSIFHGVNMETFLFGVFLFYLVAIRSLRCEIWSFTIINTHIFK